MVYHVTLQGKRTVFYELDEFIEAESAGDAIEEAKEIMLFDSSVHETNMTDLDFTDYTCFETEGE